MNWFENAEKKRALIISGIVIISIAILFVTSRLHNISSDSYWHLKTGLDWLSNGTSFWFDHYSFTFEGKEISGPPFIFEIIVAWLVSHFGLVSGFEIFKLLSFALTFSLVIYFLVRLKAPAMVYCLVLPILTALLQMRAMVRPELISFSFAVVAIILYQKANNKITLANLLPIAVLMLVWSNYHTSVFGYVIFFGFFLDAGIEQLRNKASSAIWFGWLFWGAVVLAVGFINPGFNHTIIAALHFDEGWKTWIAEYRSSSMYLTTPIIYALIAISVATGVMLVRIRQFGLLVACLVLCYNATLISRLVTPSGIVMLCVFAWKLSEIDINAFLKSKSITQQRTFGVLAGLVFLAAIFSAVYTSRDFMKQNSRVTRFPVDVTDYMIKNNIGGKVFNEYGMGGYLIYRLAPNTKVFIDGRTEILYPLEHYFRYLNATTSPVALKSEIDTYGINLAVLANTQRNYSLVKSASDLNLDFVGSAYSLFKKGKANFPLLGSLLASPACMNNGMTEALEAEQATAHQLLPTYTALSPALVSYLIDYSKAPDKVAFIGAQKIDDEWSSIKLRFTAYWALSEGLDSMAYSIFVKIKQSTFTDFLGISLAQINLGEWKSAESTLDQATRRKASSDPNVISLLHKLLIQIQEHATLELFDQSYIDGLVPENEDRNARPLNGIPDVSDFCFSES